MLIQPRVAGYQLTNMRLGSVPAGDDTQLFIGGSLHLDGELPDAGGGTALPAPVVTSVSVETPDAALVRAAVLVGGGDLPMVTLDVPEGPQYVWHIAHGSSGVGVGPLKISDRSFAWQGAHQIEVRARTGSDESTTSEPTVVTPVIDYAPPTIFADAIKVDGSLVTVPARDAVTPAAALRRAFGRVGGPVPVAGFINDDTVDLGALADGDEVMLYVADEANHVASVKLQLHGTGNGAGGAGGSDGAGATAGTDPGGSGSGVFVGGGAGESADGPTEMEAGAPAGGAANGTNANEDSGCGCRIQRAHRDHPALLLVVLGLGLLWRRRYATSQPARRVQV
jgi:MYXO-CTERM domain-containing protein